MSFFTTVSPVGGPKIPEKREAQKQQTAQTLNVKLDAKGISLIKGEVIYYFDKKNNIFVFQPNENSDTRLMSHAEIDDFIKAVNKDPKVFASEKERINQALENHNFSNIRYTLETEIATYIVDENTENHTRTIKPYRVKEEAKKEISPFKQDSDGVIELSNEVTPTEMARYQTKKAEREFAASSASITETYRPMPMELISGTVNYRWTDYQSLYKNFEKIKLTRYPTQFPFIPIPSLPTHIPPLPIPPPNFPNLP